MSHHSCSTSRSDSPLESSERKKKHKKKDKEKKEKVRRDSFCHQKKNQVKFQHVCQVSLTEHDGYIMVFIIIIIYTFGVWITLKKS